MIEQLNHCMQQLRFPESAKLQQRGIADKIEDSCNEIILNSFDDVVLARSRRSIEDISIGNTYVDHKTSDAARDFKMPNLISIDRLRKLDRPLVYNFVVYDSDAKSIIKTFALDVYHLNWDHLSIQNLGAGQLQITNMIRFLEDPVSKMTPDEWRHRLKIEAVKFYQNLIIKTERRKSSWL